jgi:hypothetical protein
MSSTSLVRFLTVGRRCHCALHFAREGGLVGGHLARVLECEALARAPAPAQVPAPARASAPRAAALASALEAAAAGLAPARLPGDAADAARADIDFRYDVLLDEEDDLRLRVELREWTNDTATFNGDAVALVRHVRAGFGQC